MGNRVIVIIIALALAAGAASLYLLGGEGKSSSNASALGQTLFPQLKAAEVTRISIQEPQATLTLEKKEGRWLIAERGGFPADLDRVSELVVKAIELKTGQTEPISEKERARMQLGVPGKGEGAATLVTFKAQDGKTLAELLVGKKYFRNPPEGDAGKAQGDGRFVMLPADPARVIVISDPLKLATSTAGEWIARDGVAIENIKSLKVKLADDAFALERDNLDAPWKLEGKDGELDPSRASAIGFALAKLEVVDVAAAGADAGFDQGSLIAAATTDGLEYKLKIGKLDKDRYMVQVALDGTPTRAVRAAPADEKAEDKDKREKAAAEELKRFTERIAREKALGPFTVLIAKAKIDEVLKKRADLLKQEKKEEKK